MNLLLGVLFSFFRPQKIKKNSFSLLAIHSMTSIVIPPCSDRSFHRVNQHRHPVSSINSAVIDGEAPLFTSRCYCRRLFIRPRCPVDVNQWRKGKKYEQNIRNTDTLDWWRLCSGAFIIDSTLSVSRCAFHQVALGFIKSRPSPWSEMKARHF